MKRARHALAATVFACALVAVAIAQQTLVVDVNLTMLTVRVRDTQGKPVLHLSANDFEILEDGHLRPASHLSLQRQSAAIGIPSQVELSKLNRTGRLTTTSRDRSDDIDGGRCDLAPFALS